MRIHRAETAFHCGLRYVPAGYLLAVIGLFMPTPFGRAAAPAMPFSGLSLEGLRSVHGLAYDADTNTLFGTNLDTDRLITIDVATGATNRAGTSTGRDVRRVTCAEGEPAWTDC